MQLHTSPWQVGLLGWCLPGEKDFSVNEQLNIFSIGVGEDLGESRTELVDIPDRFKASVSGAS